jgi:hypothetical protein
VTNLKRAKQIHDVTMRGADKDKVYITYVDLRIVKILLFIILTVLDLLNYCSSVIADFLVLTESTSNINVSVITNICTLYFRALWLILPGYIVFSLKIVGRHICAQSSNKMYFNTILCSKIRISSG